MLKSLLSKKKIWINTSFYYVFCGITIFTIEGHLPPGQCNNKFYCGFSRRVKKIVLRFVILAKFKKHDMQYCQIT